MGARGKGETTFFKKGFPPSPVHLTFTPSKGKIACIMTDTAAHEKNKAASQSLGAAVFLTAIKLGAGLYTNSLGLYSEALHSGIDLVAALLTIFSLRIAAMPADANHPYGHGKAENLSALAQTALLLLTCGWIIGEAIERLFMDSSAVTFSFAGVAVIIISIIVDVSRSRMLRRVAEKHQSQALEADALHFTTDIWSSCVVLVGLMALWAASFLPPGHVLTSLLHRADAFAALIVAVIVLKAGYDLSRKAINELMDGGREGQEEKIREALGHIGGISSVRRLRLRGSGATLFVDLAVGVDAALSVDDGRKIAEHAEKSIAGLFQDVDVSVRVEPEDSGDERGILATVRGAALKHGLAVHSVRISGGRELHIEVHVETDGDMPLAKAHELVSRFEEDTVKACGGKAAVITHLEPRTEYDSPVSRVEVGADERERVRTAINEALSKVENISDCHKLDVCRIGCLGHNDEPQPLSVSFHCRLPAEISVAEAHHSVTMLERRLRQEDPALARVVIHMEPGNL